MKISKDEEALKKESENFLYDRRNRILYIAEAAFEYFIAILITGAFLAAILTNIGVDDSLIGVISTLASFANLAQFFAVIFIRPKGSVKNMVTIIHLINQLMFVILYMIPYIHAPQTVKITVFIAMFIGGCFLGNVVSPFKVGWLMSYVRDNDRGRFTANKEIISLIGGMIFSYVMGAVIDHFNEAGKTETGFIICGLTILVLCILHFISLVAVRENANDKKEKIVEKKSISDVLGCTVFDKQFRKIIYLDMMWNFAIIISTSFYGTYLINELGFGLKYVAVLSAMHSVVRVLFSKFFGKIADRRSWADMLVISFFIGALSFLINTFTTPSNGKILYAIYCVIYAVFLAGGNSGIFNITFDYTLKENRICAVGVKTAIGGLWGFFTSLIGARIVSAVQANNNIVLGHTIYAQQILSFISFIIFAIIIVYTKTVILKMKRHA